MKRLVLVFNTVYVLPLRFGYDNDTSANTWRGEQGLAASVRGNSAWTGLGGERVTLRILEGTSDI